MDVLNDVWTQSPVQDAVCLVRKTILLAYKQSFAFLVTLFLVGIIPTCLYSQVDLSGCPPLPQEHVGFGSVVSPTLFSIDSSFRCILRTLKTGEPSLPKALPLSDFPRYRKLQADLKGRMRDHKVFVLRQPLLVAQRVGPTYIMAENFYSQANDLGFCDDGVCRYHGNTFVTLKRASLSPDVHAGTWLQYVGLARYTTVLGAPETLPQFRVVTDEEFPDLLDATNAVQHYRPTEKEAAEALNVRTESYRREELKWLRQAVGQAEGFLRERSDAVANLPVDQSQDEGGPTPSLRKLLPEFSSRYQAASTAALKSLTDATPGEEALDDKQLQKFRAIYDHVTSRLQDAISKCPLDSATWHNTSIQWLNVGCWTRQLAGVAPTSEGYLGVHLASEPVAFGGNFVSGVLEGARVTSVDLNSPAASAGIEAGDAIALLNGQPITSPSEVATLVARTPRGTDVELGIVVPRVTAQRVATLSAAGATECGEMLTFSFTKSPGEPAGFHAAEDLVKRMTYAQSSPRCSRKVGWIVEAFDPGSPAVRAGIRVGDILEGIGALAFSPDTSYGQIEAGFRALRSEETVTVRVLRPFPGDYNLDHHFFLRVRLTGMPQ